MVFLRGPQMHEALDWQIIDFTTKDKKSTRIRAIRILSIYEKNFNDNTNA